MTSVISPKKAKKRGIEPHEPSEVKRKKIKLNESLLMNDKHSRHSVCKIEESDADENNVNSQEVDEVRNESHCLEVNDSRPEEDTDAHEANFYFEDIHSDDEIFTFQCPQDFNVESLLKKKIDLDHVTSLTDNVGNDFSCRVIKNEERALCMVVPSREGSKKINAKLTKLPAAGHIIITKVENIHQEICKPKEVKKSNVLHPFSNSISRHPLLGTDWKEQLIQAKIQIKKNKKRLKKILKLKKQQMEDKRKRKVEMSNVLAPFKKKKIKQECDD